MPATLGLEAALVSHLRDGGNRLRYRERVKAAVNEARDEGLRRQRVQYWLNKGIERDIVRRKIHAL